MLEKIKEALRQGYKNLGVPESAVDGLAALGVTVVSEESGIDAFVQSESVKAMMKSYQSEADKIRTKASGENADLKAKIAELEAKLNDNQTPPAEKPEEKPDMAKIIADAVAAAIKPISDELSQFKGEQAAKNALATAEAAFKGNDYVKKYAEEATDAWERTLELYAFNKEWTDAQITEKAMGYFNKAVSRKGVDTSKPFESDGKGDQTPDFKGERDLLKAQGIELPE